MSAGELIVSRENSPLVALGMTGASFDGAQRVGVTHIEADTDAMEYIARQVGYTKPSEALSPLVVITRDSNDTRALIGRWDDRLPVNQGSPNTGRFFPANHLDRQMPASANRELFVEVARNIGAYALTEISVPSWHDDVTHAGDFATGLLLGQRPLDLPPKPSLLGVVGNLFNTESRALAAIKAVRADRAMPKPFIITRQPKRPEIEKSVSS